MEAWRRVEVAAAEELEGPTPRSSRRSAPRRSRVEAVQERERSPTTTSRPSSTCSPSRPAPAGRWIHFGLTSSDVLDTGARPPAQRGRRGDPPGRARARRARCAERAREHARHALRRAHARRPRRADDLRPQARGLRLRGAPQRASGSSAPSRRPPSARSPAPSAPTPRTSPDYEARVLERLGLAREPVSTQVVPARPPRRAAAGDRAGRRRARAPRHRGPPPPAHRGERGRGAVPRRGRRARARCPTSATRSTPSGSPGSRACCAATPTAGARERRPVARARHLALLRRARDPPGLDDPARLRAAPARVRVVARHDGARRPDAREPRAHPRRAVLPARAARAGGGAACSATTPTGSSRRSAQRAWDERHPAARAARRRAGGRGPRPRRDLRLRPVRAPRGRISRAGSTRSPAR